MDLIKFPFRLVYTLYGVLLFFFFSFFCIGFIFYWYYFKRDHFFEKVNPLLRKTSNL